MTEIKDSGLVVGERDLGENDKLLTILTEKYGKLFVVAKGVKSVKNRHMACCQLFSYASFALRKRGNYFYILDSDLIENYYDIRTDILRVSLASYICEVVNDIAQEGNCEDRILKLTLNTLFAIAKNTKSLDIIKASFELRILVESGFSPQIDVCSSCSSPNVNGGYLDLVDGVIVCDKCRNNSNFTIVKNEFLERGLSKPIALLSNTVILAMRYIINSKQERFLSYTIDETEVQTLSIVCEKFLLNQLERSFYTLEFYKSLK